MADFEGTVAEVTDFVHRFHADLTGWFSGDVPQAEVWQRLKAASADMRLIYPSGRRLEGRAFLDSIRDRWGGSPGFRAVVSEVEVLEAGADFAVIAYVEAQTGARASAAENQRTATAIVRRGPAGWRWTHLQETAIVAEPEKPVRRSVAPRAIKAPLR